MFEMKLHGSSSHRGQQSPGDNGNGFSHVSGGHSSFQQSNSPYCKESKQTKNIKEILFKYPFMTVISTKYSPDIHKFDTDKSTVRRTEKPGALIPGAGTTPSDHIVDSTGPGHCHDSTSSNYRDDPHT